MLATYRQIQRLCRTYPLPLDMRVEILKYCKFDSLRPDQLLRWIIAVVPEEGFFESQNKFQEKLAIVDLVIQTAMERVQGWKMANKK
jgi:hypothetical protein